MQRLGKDGLCMTVDHFSDFMYGNAAFLKAIETVYRYVGGSVIYTCNMFFHVQLLHAIRLDCIPVTEDNWLRANEFATQVFNRKIEDARFIVFQAYVGDEEAANSKPVSAAGEWPSTTRSGYYGSVVNCAVDSDGNEHNSPFQNAYYMDKQARRHIRFLLENHSEEIMQRAREHGPRPMPVALQVDEKSMLPFDVQVRNALIAFIWEDIPHSRIESKEITLLRALELLNGEIADRCGFYSDNLHLLLDEDINHDESAEDEMVITDASELGQVPVARMAQVLGTSFAQQFFAEGQLAFLSAMLHDHPFRPITRDELRVWMSHGTSPFGNDVEYKLNSKLYKYLKGLRVRPSSKQWLSTSAVATLSMLRRTLNATRHKKNLGHIDIEAIAVRFHDIEQNARCVSESTTESSDNASPHSTSTRRLSMTAFGKPPEWVAQLSNPRPDYTPPTPRRQHDASTANSAARAQPLVNGHASAHPTTLPVEACPSSRDTVDSQAQPTGAAGVLTTQPLDSMTNPGNGASMTAVLQMFAQMQAMVEELKKSQ
ncbi:hypothetical protein IWW38_002883 [Coemansia aciculifera]|uniref:Uncharacterized protein n=1 Tax=Coemansia aciculifera TaxID=417176 RepID=A0ACC1M306_9FUNG|nr:hypothetical protein IWW38_002883 [Coemansia aciculifera]